MEFALTKNGKRVSAYSALRDMEYFCPCCKQPLILKAGEINAHHFSHKAGECTDLWHYDMSEWHQHMQNFFLPEHREIVVSHNGKIHRADVLIDKTVIEFQHSSISGEEFRERTEFFVNAGYRIAWIFDVSDAIADGNLYELHEDVDDGLLRWKNPLRILKNTPLPQYKSSKISICIGQTFTSDGEIYDNVFRIMWCPKGEDDKPNYRVIAINTDCYLEFSSEMNTNILFTGDSKAFIKEIAKEIEPYDKKVLGHLKGLQKHSYCCPKTDNWIEVDECTSCECCAISHTFKENNERLVNIYCTYPRPRKENFYRTFYDRR